LEIFDVTEKTFIGEAAMPALINVHDLFIVCSSERAPQIAECFGFNPDTVEECMDLDESVRFTSYNGYDFISCVQMEMNDDLIVLHEVNLYISKKYIVLVLPDKHNSFIRGFRERLNKNINHRDTHANKILWIYFMIFHELLSDLSDFLEGLEDKIEALAENMSLTAAVKTGKELFTQIMAVRKVAYTAKKELRSMSYIGASILIDENTLMDKRHTHYFHSIDTRLKKLYDFSESLFVLACELLYTYDSRLTMKTNDTITKLTVITLFFCPMTVITGIYGMNFVHMPELEWVFGYPAVILLMGIISLIIYLIMKKKDWL
jgi:magnesium transporter